MGPPATHGQSEILRQLADQQRQRKVKDTSLSSCTFKGSVRPHRQRPLPWQQRPPPAEQYAVSGRQCHTIDASAVTPGETLAAVAQGTSRTELQSSWGATQLTERQMTRAGIAVFSSDANVRWASLLGSATLGADAQQRQRRSD